MIVNDFNERMDRAEDIIRRAREAGMDIELSDGKLVICNAPKDLDLRDEIVRCRKDIAEWLSIPPAEVTDRVMAEFTWLREFAEEFAKTAWRRLGCLTESEVIQFYNLASADSHDENASRIEPGRDALIAVADARLEQIIDRDRVAHERGLRDECDPSEWMVALELSAARLAKEGRWK